VAQSAGAVLAPDVGGTPLKFTLGTLNWESQIDAGGLFTPSSVLSSVDVSNMAIDTEYGSGWPKRIVAGGFEVINTTSEIYAQGLATCFQLGAQHTDAVLSCTNELGVTTENPGIVTRSPPAGLDLAVAQKNILQWMAKDGCYIPMQLDPERSEFVMASRGSFLFQETESSASGYPTQGIVAYDSSTGFNHYIRYQTMGLSGAFFSGLSPQTSLVISATYVVEVQPLVGTAMNYVQPAPVRDERALELYYLVRRFLPIACRKEDNDFGDWLRWVFKAISSVASIAAPIVTVFNPAAGAAVGAVGAGASAASSAFDKNKKKKRETTTVVVSSPPLRTAGPSAGAKMSGQTAWSPGNAALSNKSVPRLTRR
jgi:hypothetical protein